MIVFALTLRSFTSTLFPHRTIGMFSQTRTTSPRTRQLLSLVLLPYLLTMPVGNVLVGDSGGNVEHDDCALSVDVVTVSQTTELLLTSRVPDIELDWTQVL